MKLQPDANQANYVITAQAADRVDINGLAWQQNLCLAHASAPRPWAEAGFDGLAQADFDALLELGADIVLIGTGSRQRFPAPALLRGLMAARIGVEVMTTPAACRTYNVLVGEGRRAALALLLDGQS